jgi:glycosyltransferase involved in cell wall biosynthesis
VTAVYVNGKFCAQRTTGVQRYARCALEAIDARLAARPDARRWTLLLPPDAVAPALRAVHVQGLPWNGPGGLHGWEQWALPRAARGGLLLNLAGSAPAWGAAAQLCVMHDAAPFDQPQAYTTAFATWYRWLFRHLATRPATRLVTVSDFSRERLAAALKVPSQRFAVAPGGAQHFDAVPADTAVLGAHGLQGQRFVLAVASRNPTKNLARLAQAWPRVGRADVQLALVGGANVRVFGGDAATPTAAGWVDVGPLDDAGLKALYEHASAFVFPSLYEGFGLPPLEAMACGCPVAVSDIPALRAVAGDAALLFDPLSPPSIADALRRLLDDAALRDDLRERGRRRAALFTWDATAQALLGVAKAVP